MSVAAARGSDPDPTQPGTTAGALLPLHSSSAGAGSAAGNYDVGRIGGEDAVDAAALMTAAAADGIITPSADSAHPIAESTGAELGRATAEPWVGNSSGTGDGGGDKIDDTALAAAGEAAAAAVESVLAAAALAAVGVSPRDAESASISLLAQGEAAPKAAVATVMEGLPSILPAAVAADAADHFASEFQPVAGGPVAQALAGSGPPLRFEDLQRELDVEWATFGLEADLAQASSSNSSCVRARMQLSTHCDTHTARTCASPHRTERARSYSHYYKRGRVGPFLPLFPPLFCLPHKGWRQAHTRHLGETASDLPVSANVQLLPPVSTYTPRIPIMQPTSIPHTRPARPPVQQHRSRPPVPMPCGTTLSRAQHRLYRP
jgi:hypothetical protein